MNRRTLLAAGTALAAAPFAARAQAGDVAFLSTQLRPVEEATKMRDVILRGAPVRTTYVTEEPQNLTTRVRAEAQAGRRTVSLVGALHGELQPLAAEFLDPLDDLATQLADRGIPENLLTLGKFGGQRQLYVPWMQATYIMAAHRRALEFLPAGADVNALSYDQLNAWAGAIRQRTNQRRLGFPAGPRGLMARFFQGYLYPSFTGGVVRTFRSPEAERGWEALKALWVNTAPASTTYNFMQEPLAAGEVWIAFDHVARLMDALRAAPNDFVTFPAPAGPMGRGYMPVIAGLGIVRGAPNRAGAAQLIEYLSRPATQLRLAAETGFFPVVRADLPPDLPPAVRLAANAIAATQDARDAKVSLLPVGLGDKGGEFNKVYTDAFQRIVLRNENIRAVLDAEANALRTVMNATGAPCWSPDAASDGACPVA
jgi:multiple sugar transport system substrate-binding protein